MKTLTYKNTKKNKTNRKKQNRVRTRKNINSRNQLGGAMVTSLYNKLKDSSFDFTKLKDFYKYFQPSLTISSNSTQIDSIMGNFIIDGGELVSYYNMNIGLSRIFEEISQNIISFYNKWKKNRKLFPNFTEGVFYTGTPKFIGDGRVKMRFDYISDINLDEIQGSEMTITEEEFKTKYKYLEHEEYVEDISAEILSNKKKKLGLKRDLQDAFDSCSTKGTFLIGEKFIDECFEVNNTSFFNEDMDVNILGSSITNIKKNPNKDLSDFCSLIQKENTTAKGGGKLKGGSKFKEDNKLKGGGRKINMVVNALKFWERTPTPNTKTLGNYDLAISQADNNKRKQRLRNKGYTYLYHATKFAVGYPILKHQFMCLGSRGLFGAGIYFATNPHDTNHKLIGADYRNNPNQGKILLKVKVLLGEIHPLSFSNTVFDDFNKLLLHRSADSVYVNGRLGDEVIVYFPDQIVDIELYEIDNIKYDNSKDIHTFNVPGYLTEPPKIYQQIEKPNSQIGTLIDLWGPDKLNQVVNKQGGVDLYEYDGIYTNYKIYHFNGNTLEEKLKIYSDYYFDGYSKKLLEPKSEIDIFKGIDFDDLPSIYEIDNIDYIWEVIGKVSNIEIGKQHFNYIMGKCKRNRERNTLPRNNDNSFIEYIDKFLLNTRQNFYCYEIMIKDYINKNFTKNFKYKRYKYVDTYNPWVLENFNIIRDRMPITFQQNPGGVDNAHLKFEENRKQMPPMKCITNYDYASCH